MHRELGRAAARRIRGVAIHPILGDVDVKAAEIDGAKMIDAMINLVELEGGIRAPAFGGDLVEPIENPAIDHCSVGGTRFRASWTCRSTSLRIALRIIKKIS